MPDATWNYQTDDAYGYFTSVISAGTYTFSLSSYYLSGTQLQNNVQSPAFSCQGGKVTSTDPTQPQFAMTPSGVFVGDDGHDGGFIGLAAPTANLGTTAILQAGREFRGFVFMNHPPLGPDGITPVDKTQAIWSRTLGNGLITAGEYTNFAGGVEDSCPSGDSCGTLSLDTEVSPGLFAGTMTDKHAGAHPFALTISLVNGKYMVFGISYNDAPDHSYHVLLVEQ